MKMRNLEKCPIVHNSGNTASFGGQNRLDGENLSRRPLAEAEISVALTARRPAIGEHPYFMIPYVAATAACY